ncbi:MAG TPA: aminotransferase class V-fold PLP-dependent enzyme [Alphaproteobacteria bacterium]|nr:aminotransferase class V-fold PLP-dependent enzyme [Alphaproteobacteria bacterium]
MAIDLARVRADTPGIANVLHLNNAGAALPPRPVTEAVIAHLRREAEIGGYEAAEEAEDKLEHCYDAIAQLLNCSRDEIAFVENATRAWDMAFYAFPFREGDRILTGKAEYASNYIAFLQVARRTGARVEAIDDDEHGQISIDALERAIDKHVKLIALTHVPTNGGLVNPAAEVGRVARAASIPYLLDACQSAGQLPLDVERLGCDMLSATGRKYLRGPRATGFLYVRRSRIEGLEPPFLDLHAATWTTPDRYEIRTDARRFENWETNFAGKIGLGVAVDYALGHGVHAIAARVQGLAADLRDMLNSIPGVRVRDKGLERCGIVTFTAEGKSAEELQSALARRGINTSVSSASSTLLDMAERKLDNVVRASVHYYNSQTELERFVIAVADLARAG